MSFYNTERKTIRRNARWLLWLTAFSLISCSNDQPTTWDDVKKLTIKTSVDGVNFDIPLNYVYGSYAQNIYNWPTVSKDIREGNSRSTVDFVKIYALLPDLEPVTEENLTAFMELGWGAYLRHLLRISDRLNIISNTRHQIA